MMRLQSRIDELERNRSEIVRDGDGGTTASSPASGEASSSNHHAHDNDANAMMGLMEEVRPGEGNNPVGDSSAASFMSKIKSVLDQQSTPPDMVQRQQPRARSSPGSAPVLVSRHDRRPFRRPDYVLPSRHQADHLLQVYWQLVDSLYPFLDKDDFTTKYHSLWTGKPAMEDENGFICLINAVFSIASHLDSSIPPAERIGAAEVFYRRAQLQMGLDLLQCRSVQTVQCFLLLGQYLQSTNDPQQCWVFTGLAIRIAQSLGLDLPSTSAHQTQRKVWHGCVLMDRTLSMTFGRPAVITSQAAASVPSPFTHPNLTACSCHTELCIFDPDSPDLHFFIECLKLYEVMGETLLALYNPVPEADGSGDSYAHYFGGLGAKAAGTVLEMDSKFGQWIRSLPLHLRYEPEHGVKVVPKKSRIHLRQTNVLWIRYCHIRTLLFRPVLSRFCTATGAIAGAHEGTLAHKLALQCSVMCVRSALDTLSLFGPILEQLEWDELDDILPSWWYSIFYLYTAATVLVAARLNPTVEAEVGEEVIANASRAATAALRRYEIFGRHAKRCAAAIGLLFDQIPPHHPHQQHHNSIQQQVEQQRPPWPPSRMHSSNLGGGARAQVPDGGSLEDNDDQNRRWETWSSQVLRDRDRHLSEAGSEQAWIYDQRANADPTTPGYLTEQHAPSVDILEASDLRFDLGGDMSWLSSMPFDLYSEF